MKTIYQLLMIILIISCKSQDKSLYEFDPRSLDENKITLAEIADDITYIPLEDIFPLGLIYSSFEFIDSSIYLSVKDIGILVFNRDGRFLRKVGSIGRGPGEYTFYAFITIYDKKGTIYVRDRSDIKAYSKTGNFLRSITLQEYGDMIDEIKAFNSKLFISYSPLSENAKYEWIILDTLGNLIKKKERMIPMFRSGWSGSHGTYKFEDKMFYWNNYYDTVFSILPDLSYKASFIISPGEHRFPRSNFDPTYIKNYFHLIHIMETNRFLTLRYFYKKRIFVLIDKNNRESFLTYLGPKNSGGIVNDLDGGTLFLPESYFVENGREYMIGLVNPLQIKTHVTSNEFKNSIPKYPEKKKELEKLANNLKETDNPVFVMVRLKK